MKEDLLCYSDPKASHRLVLLHGWGADAEDLLPIGQYLREINGRLFEIVAFRAPQIHINGIGRQWYELFPADWASAKKEVVDLKNRLGSLDTSSIPLSKTVVLGFSQGGAMAIAAGCEMSVAALIGCSAYPHLDWSPPSNRPPILLCHGDQDEIVPKDASNQLMTLLQESNVKVNQLIFDGGHEIPELILPEIKLFLQEFIK